MPSRLPLLLTLVVALLMSVAPTAVQAMDEPAATAADVNASAHARVSQRKATGFMLTAMGTVPVLLGMLLEVEDERDGGPTLVATGMAMEATGAALLMPWEQPRQNTLAGRSRPIVRVLVAYKQGGVKIGLVGRF